MKHVIALLGYATAISLGGGALYAQVPALNPARLGQLRTYSGGNLSPNDLLSDPTVLFEDGRYRMWYTTVANAYTSQQVMGIGYAESLDGTTWLTLEDSVTGEPILVVQPTPGGWDTVGVETPSVTRAPSGKYLLYYSGDRSTSSNYWAIGLAQSDDGYTWTKYGAAPVFSGSGGWEGPFLDGTAWHGGVCEPSVLYDPVQKIFKMWYAGFGLAGSIPGYRIGYATSTNGLSWTRRATPVFSPGLAGSWDAGLVSQPHVVYDPTAAAYHLFYFGASTADVTYAEANAASSISGAVGYAYSKDGITWQKRTNHALSKTGASWEGWTIGAPAALVETNTLKLWYHGFGSRSAYTGGLGLATTSIPR